VVGINAAKIAVGLGAHVTVLDVSHDRLQYLDDVFAGRVQTLASHAGNIHAMLPRADLLIGAVLIPGARARSLVTRDMLGLMKRGSVIVDVSVDQGGCVETIRPTTHDEPTYVVDGRRALRRRQHARRGAEHQHPALSDQTLPYALRLAADPWRIARRPGAGAWPQHAPGMVTHGRPPADGVVSGARQRRADERLGPEAGVVLRQVGNVRAHRPSR
jgi:alanine dehydrogenase